MEATVKCPIVCAGSSHDIHRRTPHSAITYSESHILEWPGR